MAWKASWTSSGSRRVLRQTRKTNVAVSLDQGRESQLGRIATLRREPFEQLSVRQLADDPQIEESSELPLDNSISPVHHRSKPLADVVARAH